MNCLACQEWLSQSFDGPGIPCAEVDLHVRTCDACRSLIEAADRLRVGLPRLRKPTPSPGLTARLVTLVQQDRRRRLIRRRLVLAASFAVAASVLVVVSLRFWPEPSPAPTPDLVELKEPTPTNQPNAMDSAVGAAASFASRTTTEAVEQTKNILPHVVEPDWPELPLQPSMPTTLSLREAAQGVGEGIEPVASHARRAVGLLRRDLLPSEMKPDF